MSSTWFARTPRGSIGGSAAGGSFTRTPLLARDYRMADLVPLWPAAGRGCGPCKTYPTTPRSAPMRARRFVCSRCWPLVCAHPRYSRRHGLSSRHVARAGRHHLRSRPPCSARAPAPGGRRRARLGAAAGGAGAGGGAPQIGRRAAAPVHLRARGCRCCCRCRRAAARLRVLLAPPGAPPALALARTHRAPICLPLAGTRARAPLSRLAFHFQFEVGWSDGSAMGNPAQLFGPTRPFPCSANDVCSPILPFVS